MKILIYGMQSSGASLITFFFAQKPDSIAVVDLYNEYEAPNLDDVKVSNIILKCVVNTRISLKKQIENFKPDKKILVLRHPFYNYASLKAKVYANQSGAINDKFRLLENMFINRIEFDLIVLYEDFILYPGKVIEQTRELDFGVSKEFYRFNRKRESILEYNKEHSKWCKNYYNKQWGFGIIKGHHIKKHNLFRKIKPDEKKEVRKWCHSLCSFYENKYDKEISLKWLYYMCIVKESLLPFYKKFHALFSRANT